MEKVIRALLLLEGLSESGLPFVFKGGTALMLLMNSTKRLSIDIDIVISNSPKNLDEIFEAFAKQKGFTKVEIQHRATSSNIQKSHYKFFYTPIHQAHFGEEAILLDILFEENHYKNILAVELQSSFINSKGKNATINVPSFEDLLGDKLTAFAPNTTGIPYFKKGESMSMEIIKQLYDVGNLFDVAEDLATTKATFNKIAATEIVYRNLKNIEPKDVLNDIYNTSFCIALRGTFEQQNFEQLQQGIQRVAQFIFSESYHIDKAIVAAAKATYLSQLILTEQKKFEKFEAVNQIKDAIIESPHNTKLNKLKKSNPEAFFYWWKIYELMK